MSRHEQIQGYVEAAEKDMSEGMYRSAQYNLEQAERLKREQPKRGER